MKCCANKTGLFKFVVITFIGVVAFIIPISSNGSINTVVGVLSDRLKNLMGDMMGITIAFLVVLSTLVTLITKILKKTNRNYDMRFLKFFDDSYLQVLTKIFASVIVLLCLMDIGPELLSGASTGKTMMGLASSLVAIVLTMSFILPFLTDGGLMEFVGVLARPVVYPLFKVPADASVDLIASWLGASTAAVILSAEKYKKNYYTKKETAIVMCNFSLVSVPFCMLVATISRVQEYFGILYLVVCILGILLAIITPRIYPLKNISNEYYCLNDIEFMSIDNKGIFQVALEKATNVAESFTLKSVIKTGSTIVFNVLMNLLPTVIAWGTLGLILVEYTQLFHLLSLPLGIILDFFQIDEAFKVAPTLIVGFVDMFIPALLTVSIESVSSRFIIAVLSLIQIIYITEVGAVILQTKIGIDFKKLIIIFVQRTLIALPIVVIVSKILF